MYLILVFGHVVLKGHHKHCVRDGIDSGNAYKTVSGPLRQPRIYIFVAAYNAKVV